MRGRLLPIATVVFALVGAAAPVGGVWGQTAPADAKTSKAQKTLMVLTPEDIDPVRLLPPPPIDGSPAQTAELDELRHIQAVRTPERLAQAKWDGDHEDSSAFAAVLGPRFDLQNLPATRALLAVVENDQSVAASEAKKAFHRHRPWTFEPSLEVCERVKPNAQGKPADPLTAYPSGHSTLGYSVGIVLANLIPTKAPAIMARASDYAYSRLVCEVHFRSDIVAGQALGTAVGVMLLHAAALKPQIEAARQELALAGVGLAN
jgi:acid phosphatase (class A)